MKTWKKTAVTLTLSSSLLISGAGAAWAADSQAPGSQLLQLPALAALQLPSYTLTHQLQVQVKSILNERESSSVRIGAVVRMKNTGRTLTRVPEYEVRIRTSDGIDYTMTADAMNARSIRPQSEVELSYYLSLPTSETIELAELAWVDVDYFVYPKQETVKLAVAAEGYVWTGTQFAAEQPNALVKWGEPFMLPALKSPLVFTPISETKQYAGMSQQAVIKLNVYNPGPFRETVPMFMMDGRDDKEVFKGSRIEVGTATVEPGESKYVHMAVPVKEGVKLKRLTVVTPESHTELSSGGAPKTTQYTVGRLDIALPDAGAVTRSFPYKLGDNIPLQKFSPLIPEGINTSLVELSIHESQGVGYKTVVAKVKLENGNTQPVPIPPFQAELVSQDGYTYTGARQVRVADRIMPGLAASVVYSFVVPSSETGENLYLKLQDVVSNGQTMYRSDLAALQVSAKQPGDDREFSFYPFNVKLNHWSMSATYSLAAGYAYRLRLVMDIDQVDKVIVDNDSSTMLIEIEDAFGRTLGSEEMSFVRPIGPNRKLLSGETSVSFTQLRTEQHETNLTIRMYEKIETASGPVKRLVTTFKN